MSESLKLLTVKQAAELLALPEAGLRHRIFTDADGFASRCVVRLGRSVRIRADRLAEIIEEKTGGEPFQYSERWRERNAKAAAERGSES